MGNKSSLPGPAVFRSGFVEKQCRAALMEVDSRQQMWSQSKILTSPVCRGHSQKTKSPRSPRNLYLYSLSRAPCMSVKYVQDWGCPTYLQGWCPQLCRLTPVPCVLRQSTLPADRLSTPFPSRELFLATPWPWGTDPACPQFSVYFKFYSFRKIPV